MSQNQNPDLTYYVESIAQEVGALGNELSSISDQISSLTTAIEKSAISRNVELAKVSDAIDNLAAEFTVAMEGIVYSDYQGNTIRDSLDTISYLLHTLTDNKKKHKFSEAQEQIRKDDPNFFKSV